MNTCPYVHGDSHQASHAELGAEPGTNVHAMYSRPNMGSDQDKCGMVTTTNQLSSLIGKGSTCTRSYIGTGGKASIASCTMSENIDPRSDSDPPSRHVQPPRHRLVPGQARHEHHEWARGF